MSAVIALKGVTLIVDHDDLTAFAQKVASQAFDEIKIIADGLNEQIAHSPQSIRGDVLLQVRLKRSAHLDVTELFDFTLSATGGLAEALDLDHPK